MLRINFAFNLHFYSFFKKIVFFVSHQTGFGGLPERGRERMEGAGKAAAKSLPKTRNLTNRFMTNNKRPEIIKYLSFQKTLSRDERYKSAL